MDRKSFFIISIATLITVVAWVMADVIHSTTNVEVSPDIQKVIEPLSPDFDSAAIKLLK